MNTFNDFGNPQVKNLPDHLKQFIVEQHYERYTAADHAVWRYVMRQNYSYLKDIAYYPYIPGLEAAGLSIEKIPDLQEMNDALKKIGWGAVTVNGFIPPPAFMEYQSYRVLVIAADIRQLCHIDYTPAPDIIHESAGHAPIIADKDYHEYLSYFGAIGTKAMFSSKDSELYEAIRELSILKELHEPDPALLRKAEKKVEFCQRNLGEPSEMALLSRLHWWTVEYGLIGTFEDPKIYGAGLLSSISESKGCMDPEVKKYWYTHDAVNYPFDITKPQPQLFVTPDFQTLTRVLEEFADTMAFRRGGSESILKAIGSKSICTAVYSSGLQVSGVFNDMSIARDDELQFIRVNGPCALAYGNRQLTGHGKEYHTDGFSSPVGRWLNIDKAPEDASEQEFRAAGIIPGHRADISFRSGFRVSGKVQHLETRNGKLILVSLAECTVTDPQGKVCFEPSWGIYDMAVGEKIVSVYCGPADKSSFRPAGPGYGTVAPRPEYDDKTKQYHQLFYKVRKCRETHQTEELPELWQQIRRHFREDWLCSLEILEILEQEKIYPEAARDIRIYLEMKAAGEPELNKLIYDGFHLIKNPVNQLTH